MNRVKMLYAIAGALVDRMSRDEMESLVHEMIADQLDEMSYTELQNEYDRVFGTLLR